MWDVLLRFAEFFMWAYEYDERPHAQKITVGCAIVTAGVIIVFSILWWLI